MASCISCSHPPPRSLPDFTTRPDLALVTWNLHAGAGRLDALLSDLRAGKLTGGQPPHDVVLLLQEASTETRVEGLDTFFASAQTGEPVQRGTLIASTIPLRRPRAIELPRGRQQRVAAIAAIEVGGVDLTITNVHLENRASWLRGALPGDAIRARQMDALLAAVPPGPGVLGGDLNTWFGARERAYQAAAASFPDGIADPPPATFRERLALDHLFFRLPPRWRATTLLAPAQYGSDHLPVIGVIRIR